MPYHGGERHDDQGQLGRIAAALAVGGLLLVLVLVVRGVCAAPHPSNPAVVGVRSDSDTRYSIIG